LNVSHVSKVDQPLTNTKARLTEETDDTETGCFKCIQQHTVTTGNNFYSIKT